MKIKRYGWRKDHLDQRNRKFSHPGIALPDSVDWTDKLPPCYDQGDLGSCTANAIAGAIQFLQQAQGEPSVMPSRLFIYYNERVIEGTVDSDAGAEIMDGIKTINDQGFCPEYEWIYDPDKFAVKPLDACYADASDDLLLQYLSVDNSVLNDVKAALVQGPVVGGFSVYESFEGDEAATGNVPLPGKHEQMIGGHAVLIVGYNHTQFIVRNSWGPDWGRNGYFTVPISYFTNPDLASDFWLCQRMT